MKLSEWRQRRSQGEAATLPSGLEIRVKRVSMPDLVEQGKIPRTLQPQIDAFMKGGMDATLTLEQFGEHIELINLICRTCIVEPAELDVKELPFEDRLALFNWANELSGELTFFREGEAQSVGAR